MAALRRSTYPKRKFSENWIGVGRGKANLPRNGKRKTVARSFPVYSKAKRSAHPLPFWCATKTLGPRITWRSQQNFGPHMLILLTRPHMEFAIGREEGG